MRSEQRASLSDLENLYVYSTTGPQKVPLQAISSIEYGMHAEKIERRNQFRTVTVSAFAAAGHLPSEVLNTAMPKLREFQRSLPPGYHMEIGGEYEEQVKGFKNLAMVMGISVMMIFSWRSSSSSNTRSNRSSCSPLSLTASAAHLLRCGSWIRGSASWRSSASPA
jgi:multidrug efflux pump subunit AcrB